MLQQLHVFVHVYVFNLINLILEKKLWPAGTSLFVPTLACNFKSVCNFKSCPRPDTIIIMYMLCISFPLFSRAPR